MDIPKARVKLDEAQFFYSTLEKYLYSDGGMNLNDPLGRKRAGFHLSAFVNAVDGVFEVIKKRYHLTPEHYEAWLSDVPDEAHRAQRRKEMNDLRNREVHDAEVVVSDSPANILGPQGATPAPPNISPDAGTGSPATGAWAPMLSAPSTWADGRDVLDVCEEYLRLAGDHIRWCEGLDA